MTQLGKHTAPAATPDAAILDQRGGMPFDVFYDTGAPPAELWLPDQGVAPYRGRG